MLSSPYLHNLLPHVDDVQPVVEPRVAVELRGAVGQGHAQLALPLPVDVVDQLHLRDPERTPLSATGSVVIFLGHVPTEPSTRESSRTVCAAAGTWSGQRDRPTGKRGSSAQTVVPCFSVGPPVRPDLFSWKKEEIPVHSLKPELHT